MLPNILGLSELLQQTLGSPDVCIATLDGPVDLGHPCFAGAKLAYEETVVAGAVNDGPAAQHGTHIASVIFGQLGSLVQGIAPRCRGVILPVFKDGKNGSIAPCSQVDLARSICQAIQHGAHVINISGGQFSPSGTAHPLLNDAVLSCAANGVLVVASAGNEGCACLHVPGALDSVLAVGAMDATGSPLESSNWGEKYQRQGILAPGESIVGAQPGGGIIAMTGTSYATPLVSAIAALLLSLQLQRRQRPDASAVRAALINSAVGCEEQAALDCRRLLAGRLNVSGALNQLFRQMKPQGVHTMSDTLQTQRNERAQWMGTTEPETAVVEPTSRGVESSYKAIDSPEISPSDTRCAGGNVSGKDAAETAELKASTCGCGCRGGSPAQLVFVLGQLGFDFGTEARRDSFLQAMTPAGNPHDPQQLLSHLEENPWDAASVIWTLNLDATPVYAIQPSGAFAAEGYQRLRRFLTEQLTEGVERVSVPGWIRGLTPLSTGQVVPLIYPEVRGMYSWTTTALAQSAVGEPPGKGASEQQRKAYSDRNEGVRNFLQRVYHEGRNLGMTSQDRAVNFAATNALIVAKIFESTVKDGMALDTIEVERSPICRPESDCWDVKLIFFNPTRLLEQARKVYRFTVDVSDAVPVTLGPFRSWFVR